MSFEMRPIGPDDLPAFVRPMSVAFGNTVDEDEQQLLQSLVEFDRTLATFDGAQIVGTAGAISFQLTLPGLQVTPAAGVTFVSVLPTHRRRGILTSMMRRQLADVRERGEAIAILYASESTIYGRYGYGIATTQVQWEIDRRYGTFTRPHQSDGNLAAIDRDQARTMLPGIYDRVWCAYPGGVDRSDMWWRLWLRDPESWREGASERFYVVHRSPSGQPDGYVAYRVQDAWPDGNPANTAIVTELMPATPEAYASLWTFCLNLDLVATVRAGKRPPDDSVRWMLADPRRLRVTRYGDGLWARLVDVPAALAARRYQTEGGLILEIADSFMPDNSGRYRLQGGPDGATCERAGGAADLALDVADLGAVYLGDVSLSVLARAGRVEELTAGALARADALFASDPAPWCATSF